MRKITKEVFTINELSESAKETAYNEWLTDYDYFATSENEATLNAFERIFPINVRNWSYDSYSYDYLLEFDCDEEIEELSNIRLLKYLWNNYQYAIYKGKYYSLWSKKDKSPYRLNDTIGKLKSRHSKIMMEGYESCPLTGYYLDNDILQPIFEFMNKPDSRTFYDLMDECLDSFFKACRNDCKACSSMEYFLEQAKDCDWEFYENGKMY